MPWDTDGRRFTQLRRRDCIALRKSALRALLPPHCARRACIAALPAAVNTTHCRRRHCRRRPPHWQRQPPLCRRRIALRICAIIAARALFARPHCAASISIAHRRAAPAHCRQHCASHHNQRYATPGQVCLAGSSSNSITGYNNAGYRQRRQAITITLFNRQQQAIINNQVNAAGQSTQLTVATTG